MHNFQILPVMLAMFLAFGLSPASHAQGGQGGGQNGPCRDDIKKFCSDVKPGGGGIMKCMKEHEADLSPACKARGQEAKEAFKKIQTACQDDVEKFCKGVEPGKGGVFKCLHEHEAHLSAKCLSARDELKARRKAMHGAAAGQPAAK